MSHGWFQGNWDRIHQQYQEFLYQRYIVRGDERYQYKYALEEHRHFEYEYRNIDGTGNNQEHYEWGSTHQEFLRVAEADYLDDGFTPAMIRPSAREISNDIFTQVDPHPDPAGASDMFWVWGQFIDHGINLTPTHAEPYNIQVPTGDFYFDPNSTGSVVIPLDRSEYDETTGNMEAPREQLNFITSYIDASMIYGSDQERADFLRTFHGGRLKTSEGNFLPFNDGSQDNAGGNSTDFFVSGDVRANENVGLTSMHTLFMREHNYWAEQIAGKFHDLSDEEIYQRAKIIVEAEIQKVTYSEFLPLLLGENALSSYEGYNANIDPQIANLFSTAAFRFGHSLLSSEIFRLNEDGSVIDEGNLALRDAFFSPSLLTDEGGISAILRGLSAGHAESVDAKIIDDVRNFLFGEPGEGGFDLAALNIQRGRDHGLPDFNGARVAYGLDPINSFSDLTDDTVLQNTLEDLYGDVNNIDVFVGGLIETPVADSMLGELFHTIVVDQFARLREGDRFWYEDRLPDDLLDIINHTSLSDIITRNTDIQFLQDNVMLYYDRLTHQSEEPTGHEHNHILKALNGNDVILSDQSENQLFQDRIDRVEHNIDNNQGNVVMAFTPEHNLFMDKFSMDDLTQGHDVIL